MNLLDAFFTHNLLPIPESPRLSRTAVCLISDVLAQALQMFTEEEY